MKTRPCVQCGYCCSVTPCAYGKWNHELKRCALLNDNGSCSIYNQIVAIEKTRGDKYPMMGCGCSSPLCNERRGQKMISMGLDPEIEQKEIEEECGLDITPEGESLIKELFENNS